MEFKDQLNEYIELLNCTASELSEAAGLSGATISRYRSGERIPAADSEALNALIDGLAKIAIRHNIPLSSASMQNAFASILGEKFDFESFRHNLNTLLNEVQIGNAELAGMLNYDPSYLSRIRKGQRQPAMPQEFAAQTASGLAKYTQKNLFSPDKQQLLTRLTGIPQQTFSNPPELRQELYSWLTREQQNADTPSNSIADFLKKLDEFDLEDYIRAIHFDELKVPSVPLLLPVSRHYYGVAAMRQGELDFLKSTVMSKSMEPVFMCSDMPMQDMAQDMDFGKKWMFGIAMMLKKGLHLNMIHNIDRPFQEMMLGLESWIPLYMTGQVSPYYLKGKHNNVYCHFNYVSGQTALTGECVQGFHDEGRYYLTRNKEEVAYFKQKSKRLLNAALPLMEIYRSDNAAGYYSHMNADAQTEGPRHNILSSLPLYTMPEQELLAILKRHNLPQKDQDALCAYAQKQRARICRILQNNTVMDEVPLLSEEEFHRFPMALSLSGAFYEKELLYTYSEYLKHMEASRLFAKQHPNYLFRPGSTHAFRNIQIQIHQNQWVTLSKSKAPTIHFVIRHPKMLHAFENLVIPVQDADPQRG